MPSVLWHCWVGGRKGIRPVKTERWGAGMVICPEQGADLHIAQLIPLPLTVSCFSKIQIGFTFLVPAHLGIPGKRAIKRVYVCESVRECDCKINWVLDVYCLGVITVTQALFMLKIAVFAQKFKFVLHLSCCRSSETGAWGSNMSTAETSQYWYYLRLFTGIIQLTWSEQWLLP